MNTAGKFFIVTAGCIFLSLPARAQDQPLRMTLGDALQKANTVNLQVMMANARLDQAIARIAESRSDLLPHIEGTAGGARQTVDLRAEGFGFPGLGPRIGPYNNFDARGEVTMALFDPSAFERFQAAQKGEIQSEADLQKTREDVLALVADLFIDAQRKQETVKLLQKILDKDQMAYQISADNFTQGTGTELDSNQSRANLEQTRYLLAQARLQARDACLDLAAALQLPLDHPLILLDDDDLTRALEKDVSVNFDHASNADMVLAASQLAASQANQKSAYADFLPKISGTANYGRSGASPDNGSNTYYVGLQASVPIWEGGNQQADLKEAQGAVKEARENLQDASQQEQVNIAKARVAIEETDQLRHAKAQDRATTIRALRIAFKAQETGSGTVLQVMQAKADLATAEDNYNEAQAEWVMAHIDLLHAQGRLRALVQQEGD